MAFLMGVEVEDCKAVSRFIGTKVFVNEFVAYSELGKSMSFRNEIISNGLYDAYHNGSIPLPNGFSMIWNVL